MFSLQPKHRKKFIDKKNATTYHLVPKAEGASLQFDKDDPGEFSPVVHPDDKVCIFKSTLTFYLFEISSSYENQHPC